jgi:hypothetical protein
MVLVEPKQEPSVPGDPGVCVWAPTVFPTTREVFLPLSLDSSLVIRASETPAQLDVSICSRYLHCSLCADLALRNLVHW